MSKYQALGEFLKRQRNDLVPMTFGEIEKITGAKLPASALKHRPWWSNNAKNSVMTKVWLDVGFESEQVDMPGRKLVFRRVRRPKAPGAEVTSEDSFHPAYGAMKGLVRVLPGTDLTQPADPEWAGRLDAEHGRGQER
jgi:hypothetical protein